MINFEMQIISSCLTIRSKGRCSIEVPSNQKALSETSLSFSESQCNSCKLSSLIWNFHSVPLSLSRSLSPTLSSLHLNIFFFLEDLQLRRNSLLFNPILDLKESLFLMTFKRRNVKIGRRVSYLHELDHDCIYLNSLESSFWKTLITRIAK